MDNSLLTRVNSKHDTRHIINIANDQLSILKGNMFTLEDLLIRELIKELNCKGVADLYEIDQHQSWNSINDRLQRMEADGLLTLSRKQLRVTSIGKALIRNVTNAFDLKYHESSIDKPKELFSRAS